MLFDRVDAALLQGVLLGYAGISLLTLLLFGWDKWLAQSGRWRLPERVLLLLALAGGWPGGWLGQRLFRHKLRKPYFVRRFRLALAANLGLILVLLGSPLSDGLF